jgi:hypothetical protein
MFDVCPNCKRETLISSYRYKVDEYISYFLVRCNKCGDLWQHEWVLPHTYASNLRNHAAGKTRHREKLVRVIGNAQQQKSIAIVSILLITLMITPLTLGPVSGPQFALAQSSPFAESSPFATSTPTTNTSDTTTGADSAAADLLRVGMFIFGIDNDTGNVVTYVTAKNLTKAGAELGSTMDAADNSTDGIAEVYYSFPETSAQVGDKYEACALKVNDQTVQCTSGFKSPSNRTEVAQLLLDDQQAVDGGQ